MGHPEVPKQTSSIAARAALAIATCIAVSIQFALPASGQQSPPAFPVASAWTAPSDEAIRTLLAERMKTNGVGIVVGIVSPEGRRLVTYGRSGAPALQLQREAVRRPFPAGIQLLGWSERVAQGVTIVGHDGGKEGYRSALAFNPATRVGVVILANARTDDTPIALAAYLLTGRRLGAAPAAPKQAWVDASPNLLDAYAGRYALASGNAIRIARRDNHLLMDMAGAGVTEFYASSSAEFRSNTSDETLRFRASTDGRVTGLEYLAGTRSSEAARSE